MQYKSKKIFSELSSFFKNNDNGNAIFAINRVFESIHIKADNLGYEKRHNCKLTALQSLQLLLLFPFFSVGNAARYTGSALHKMFSCNKDMFYNLMRKDCIDWREIVYRVSLSLIRRLSVRSDNRGKNADPICLVIDDTDFPKTGRRTEMIGRVFSHVSMKSILGFKALFMGLTDGKTFTLLDCALHGEMGKRGNMPQGLTTKKAAQRYSRERVSNSHAQKRMDEYMTSKMANAIEMIRRAIRHGVRFDYLLVDSWFTCAELLIFITGRHIKCHLLGMIKMGTTKYKVDGKEKSAKAILSDCQKKKLVKYSRRLRCHYCMVDAMLAGRKIRLFFYRFGRSEKWRGLLTTDTKLEAMQAYRIYAQRWSIEVCFHECKSLLNMGKCQGRDFSEQIAAMSIAMIQYNILAFVKRFEAYETIGGLFRKVSSQTLELTIAERIWQLILDIANTISELVEIDEEQMIEAIVNGNEKIAALYASFSTQNAA